MISGRFSISCEEISYRPHATVMIGLAFLMSHSQAVAQSDIRCRVMSDKDVPIVMRWVDHLANFLGKKIEDRSKPLIASANVREEVLDHISDYRARLKGSNKAELFEIGNNPLVWRATRKSVQEGIEISRKFCPQRGDTDDMLDALRHYSVSAILASKVGQKRALEIMTSHEIGEFQSNTPTPANMASTFMDEANNFLGARLGARFHKSRGAPMTEREILLEFEKDLRLGSVEVIVGPRECQNLTATVAKYNLENLEASRANSPRAPLTLQGNRR